MGRVTLQHRTRVYKPRYADHLTTLVSPPFDHRHETSTTPTSTSALRIFSHRQTPQALPYSTFYRRLCGDANFPNPWENVQTALGWIATHRRRLSQTHSFNTAYPGRPDTIKPLDKLMYRLSRSLGHRRETLQSEYSYDIILILLY